MIRFKLSDSNPTICAQSVDGVTVLDYNALNEEQRRLAVQTETLRTVLAEISPGAPLPWIGNGRTMTLGTIRRVVQNTSRCDLIVRESLIPGGPLYWLFGVTTSV